MRKPRYPVYVISKGRHANCLTAKFLLRDEVPFRLVIEPQEETLYSAELPDADLLVTPFSNLGLGSTPARNFCWEHSIERGATRHWIFDDNIREVLRLYQGRRIPCSAGPAIAAVEDFVERYENVVIGGMNYRFYGTPGSPAFRYNVHVYSGLLIQNDLPHRWRLRYNEDVDLCLQVIDDGWCTVLVNVFLIDKLQTMTMRGGNTDELYKGHDGQVVGSLGEDGTVGRLAMARTLEKTWPQYVTVDRRWGRAQHVIDWSQFKHPLVRRSDVDFDALPSVDEYGLDLIAQREVKHPNLQAILAQYRARREEEACR